MGLWRMLVIGCLNLMASSANKAGTEYIFDSGDVISALGATVVGILGSIYGRWSPGDALPSMMPGILILLPVSQRTNWCLTPSSLLSLQSGWSLGSWRTECELSESDEWYDELAHNRAEHGTRWDLEQVTELGVVLTPTFEVTIGITVGLFGSTSIVWTFMGATKWMRGAEKQQKAQIGTAF
jgi:hypothetical protein